MKATKSIIVTLFLALFVSGAAMAQSGAKVIAVVNKAAWCPVCKENRQRAMMVFMDNNKDMAIKFIDNDLTNKETIEKSAQLLKKAKLEKAMADYKGTGVVYLFNAKTKKLISYASLSP